jgi:transposase
MEQSHRRHDMSDETWELARPRLMGRKGTWGGNARDNRKFVNAVMWVLRTGAPWRDLPPHYGDWNNTHRRFCRWRDKGAWETLLEVLKDDPDYEWLMIGTSRAMADGNGKDTDRTKADPAPRYTWPWMRMVCRSEMLLQEVPPLVVRRLGSP